MNMVVITEFMEFANFHKKIDIKFKKLQVCKLL